MLAGEMRTCKFEQLDANNDGRITRAERDAAQRGAPSASGGASRPATSAGGRASPSDPSSPSTPESERRAQARRRIAFAQLYPDAPAMPPPGWVPGPQSHNPLTGVR